MLKYVARASVAIPFVIALGFALAAIAVMLVERFGHVTAYWMMAGGPCRDRHRRRDRRLGEGA